MTLEEVAAIIREAALTQRYRVTPRAGREMRRNGVPEALLEEILAAPERIVARSHPGRPDTYRLYGRHPVRVAVSVDDAGVTVLGLEQNPVALST